MKKILTLFAAVLLGGAARAQMTDKQMEGMMVKRTLTEADVAYNIADMAPRLYREGKMDTLEQLLGYFERNYGAGSATLPLMYLLDIRKRSFNEAIPVKEGRPAGSDTALYERGILTYLVSFEKLCANMARPNGYQQSLRDVYIPYLSFVGKTAGELRSLPGLTPAERFLLKYYEHPAHELLAELDQPEYNGTRIQRAWRKYRKTEGGVRGVTVALTTGVWVPMGDVEQLGWHPSLGVIIGARGDKFSVEANITMRFLQAANYYTVVAEQKMYNTNYYLGGYIGLDGMYELQRKNKHALEVLGGVGWDGFDALPGDSKDKNAVYKTIGGLDLNAGVGYRKYFGNGRYVSNKWHTPDREFHISYVAVQGKFHRLNYDNAGGTSLSGNAFTLGVIIGTCARKAHR